MKEIEKTSLFENGLIWFGAGVSISEIVTGTYLVSLGFTKGLYAIIIGHIIGCMLLFLAGVIGGNTNKSSMETVKMSFGQKGSLLFSLLNILQLFGWTAIMIFNGAIAANIILNVGISIWSIIIGALIIMWILIGIKNLGKINTIAMSSLFMLTLVLSYIIFKNDTAITVTNEVLSFGAAIELSIAMPLSWLPLISDYTKDAKEPVKASAISAIVYGVISCWMYIIGLGAAIFTNESDIAIVLVKASLGIVGILVVILSTVTTTFLDAYSAGISFESVSKKISAKNIAILSTIVGVFGAILLPLHNIEPFLYLISSVFAPMIAILITNYFILKKDHFAKPYNLINLCSWFIGFIIYRLSMSYDIIIGNTIPVMLITMLVCLLMNKIKK